MALGISTPLEYAAKFGRLILLLIVAASITSCGPPQDFGYDVQWSSDLINSKRAIGGEIDHVEVYITSGNRGDRISRDFIRSEKPRANISNRAEIERLLAVLHERPPRPKNMTPHPHPDMLYHLIFYRSDGSESMGYVVYLHSGNSGFLKAYSPANSYRFNSSIGAYIAGIVSGT